MKNRGLRRFLLLLSLIPFLAFNTRAQTPNTINTIVGGGVNPTSPTAAFITGPGGVVKDQISNNTYVAAPSLNLIYKISPQGQLSIYAGTGIAGFSGDGDPANAAKLDYPKGLALDGSGNLFISDSYNNRIRRVDAVSGVITTYAGSGDQYSGLGFFGGYAGDGGAAASALLNFPDGLIFDAKGDLFVADTNNNVVRMIDNSPAHIITTYAGNGTAGTPGSANGDGGPAKNAQLKASYNAMGLAMDAAGNLYIADSGDSVVRAVDTSANHIITTYAGSANHTFTFLGDGGAANAAGLNTPFGVAVDSTGNLFIADTANARVRRVDASANHIISTVVGSASLCLSYSSGCGDGGAPGSGLLNRPNTVFFDSSGNLYISDLGTETIRMVSPGPASTISTLAGGGSGGLGGAATSALLALPYTVASDGSGNLYVLDGYSVIRYGSGSKTLAAYAGNGIVGINFVPGNGDNGPANQATFFTPFALALDGSGNLFVADGYTRVRRIDAVTKTITTIAGTSASCNPALNPACGDGGAATSATFVSILGLAADSQGNLYISDSGSNRIRRVDAVSGIITNFAGTGTAGDGGDSGPAASATLSSAQGIAFDPQNNLYVADTGNNVIRKIDNTPQHNISTYAFNGLPTFGGDGGATLGASMQAPAQVAVDANGNLFVGGGLDNVVRRIDATDQSILTVAGDFHNLNGGFSGDGGPSTQALISNYGVAIDGQKNLYIADAGSNRIRSVHLAPVATVTSLLPASFGPLLPGDTATFDAGFVTITNNGLDDLAITNLSTPPGFSVYFAGGTGEGCTSTQGQTSFTLSPGAQNECIIGVEFLPAANAQPGPVSGNFTFSTNDPTQPSFSFPVSAIVATPPGLTLSINLAGTGSGFVLSETTGIISSSGGLIQCPTRCSATLALNQQVTLAATVTSVGSVFTGWTVNGSMTACPGTGPCTVTMSQAENVVATFGTTSVAPALTVSAIGIGNGTITSSPVGINCTVTSGIASGTCTFSSFPAGTQTVTLTASATGTSTIAGWLGECELQAVSQTSGSCQFPLILATALPAPQVTFVFSGPTQSFTQGQIFVGSIGGMIFVYNPNGTLTQVLSSGNLTGGIYGMNFDANGNLYAANPLATGVPNGTVEFFGKNGSGPTTFGTYPQTAPSDVVVDPSGNVFVSSAGGETLELDKFAGAENGAPTSTFYPAYENFNGAGQFIWLLDDNQSMVYGTGGSSVGNFDILYNHQNPDLATNLPGTGAYQIRELSDKSLLVADTTEILRLSPTGSVIQTYKPGGTGIFYALALNPDVLSFWTIDSLSGKVYQVRISDGTLLNTINTGVAGTSGVYSLGGIAVFGQPQAGGADVSISMGSSPASDAAGAPITYTITVTNNGPISAANVAMTDAFPVGTEFLSSSTTLGTCTGTTTVTCALGTMTNGQSATIILAVVPRQASTLINTVNTTSTTPDPNTANNSASTSTPVTGTAFSLSVGEAGTGIGSVSSMPGGIICQPNCSAIFSQGAMVTLTATPAAGSTFAGWSGACAGTGSCIVTMTANLSVVANFTLTASTACNATGASIWTGGASNGNWSSASNWSTDEVPNGPGVSVCISDGHGAAQVNLDISVEVGSLVIDPGSSLTITNSQDFEVAQSIYNAGRINVSANGNPTYLSMGGAVTLTGGGAVVMSVGANGNTPYIRADVAGATLTNVNNTISGRGVFGTGGSSALSGFVNQSGGTVNANSSGNILIINSAGAVNQGLWEASGGGVLQTSVTVNNAGGTITGGATSQVQFLTNTDVQGGSLTGGAPTANGTEVAGFFGTANGNGVILDGTTQGALNNAAIYSASNAGDTELLGTINNTGSFLVTANGNPTYLSMGGAVTLTGAGTVVMSLGTNGNTPYIRSDTAGATLTNVNNTISGVGQIGVGGSTTLSSLVNQGIIDATGNALQIDATAVQNQNLLEATAGGTLEISTLVNNSGGNITANGTGAQVQFLNGTHIEGGTLNTLNSPLFFGTLNGNGALLDGTTQGVLNNTAAYTSGNSGDTELMGTINNTGSFTVAANGNPTYLSMSGAVTLTGGGSVVMSVGTNGNTPYIRQDPGSSSLINVNNTISGRGVIGTGGSAVLSGFTNQPGGTVNANSSGNVLIINSAGAVNQGLWEASGGGVLQTSVTVNNAGGTITGGATSQVQFLSGTDIQGGTLTGGAPTANGTEVAGFFGTANGNGVILDGTTQGALNNAAIYSASNSGDTELLGTINNTGSFLLTANGNPTYLSMGGAVTLTGAGTVVMSVGTNGNTPYIRTDVAGASLLNSGNSISGNGQLTVPAYTQTAGFIQIPSSVSDSITTLAVNGGVAQVDGTLSASGGVSTSGTGVISGAGSIPSNVSNAGITEGGDIPATGTLSISSSRTFTQISTGAYEVAIGGTSQFSKLIVSGSASLAGALNIRFVNGFTPASGQSFMILQAASITGTFSSINSPGLPAGLSWQVTNTGTSIMLGIVSAGSNSFTLTVAEPGSGSGTVTDDLGQINCVDTAGVVTGTCSASYLSGTVVTLTANPAVGTTFNGWSTCPAASSCSVTMNGALTEQATFGLIVPTFSVSVAELGTGTGSVTDNLGAINCSEANGVVTGTCSASYPSGTPVVLTELATAPTTFGGWGNACSTSGTAATCSLTVTSALNVTANFVPPPVMTNVTFPAGANSTVTAPFACPTGDSPCTDPNAHALRLQIPLVNSGFTVTVLETEVPPSQADGLCEVGNTVLNDFDCRFATFFNFGADANNNIIVPLCYPYANGNCVHYSVYSGSPGNEPDPSLYSGGVNWQITWNNDTFVPPARYTGSTPQLYDDPDYAPTPTSAVGSVCTQPMTIGGQPQSYACQFEFDITTFFNPTAPVDAGIGGRTKQLNDVVVAFPPNTAGQLNVTSAPDSPTAPVGAAIGFSITVSNSGPGVESAVALNDPLPAGANWSISPVYDGPGTCSITGLAGSQVLMCSFGDMAANASAMLHITGASATPGTYSNAATVTVNNQQFLTISTVTVQAVSPAFSNLTPSQSISAGTATVALSGTVSAAGPVFPSSGETVSVSINNFTLPATIGANGAFSLVFPTANIPASPTPYTITYQYAGDANLTAATDSSTALTVNPVVSNFTLTISELGTGSGNVTDNTGQINCSEANGIATGSCSGSYQNGAQVILNELAAAPATFGGWGDACSSSGAATTCNLTVNSALTATANFVPPPAMMNVTFLPMANSTVTAPFACPTGDNPCTDPNAHALQLQIPLVNSSITVTVLATEVPPGQANGLCAPGSTVANDFDCRFSTFFNYGTDANGNTIAPLCYPYANGNCVHYSVYSGAPGNEPDPTLYSGGVDWKITWNNDTFAPPAPYLGSTPHLYDDPDYAPTPGSAVGSVCTQPMTIGGQPQSYSCQFEFDITTFFDPSAPVDAGIGGRTKQLNDVVVAFPPTSTGTGLLASTSTASATNPGSAIAFTIAVSNGGSGTEKGVNLNDPLPAVSNSAWTISPVYSGPGTCSISGAAGSQVLGCMFGDLPVGANFSVGVSNPASAAGTFTNTATISAANQQVLSIASVTIQPFGPAFSALTASQAITYATPSINLSGTISALGPLYPPSGESVSITINGAKQTATIGSDGAFSLSFPTAAIPASATPYAITYSFAADADFAAAANTSTALTVNKANQTIAFAGGPASAVYNSKFAVSATATSGLPVAITASGACSIAGGTVTMTSGTGACQLAANQVGNSNFNAAPQSSSSTTAQLASSTTTVSSNVPNPSTTGQAVAIGVTVTGNGTPTGSIQVNASTGESCNATLNSGKGTCQITFTSAGPRTLTATYPGDTNFSGGTSAGVSQTVNPPALGTLRISPSSVDFGDVYVGTFAARSVTLTNTGTASIAISNVSVVSPPGGNAREFFNFGLFCPPTLLAGRSCTVGINFLPAPNQTTPQSATLVITDSAAGSPQSIPVTGTPINPQALVNQFFMSFGAQQVNTTSAPMSFTLKNTGTTPLSIKNISVVGNFALAAASTCAVGGTVNPSQSCVVSVTFTPKSRGFQAGSVFISDNAFFGLQFVGLSGLGK
jgi:uncharacterized repeat protein (TIGR01451 family)